MLSLILHPGFVPSNLAMTKNLSIRIRGLVQGVFFRASTKKKADEFNIKGLVRNQRDGSVYVEAEGEDMDLVRFVEWCRNGPPSAEVEEFEISEGSLKGFNAFVIDR